MSSNEIIAEALVELEKAYNDVVVQAANGIKNPSSDPKGAQAGPGPSTKKKIEYATEDFHTALDTIESQLKGAMSVFTRDLNQLRAKRMAPPSVDPPVLAPPVLAPPVAASESRPVAPPAPMTIESPAAEPLSSAPAAAAPQPSYPAPSLPSKLDGRPPAPLPDMGFDLTVSPEVRPSPSPALSQAKTKQVKASPKTSPKPPVAQTAAMAARPGSAPPKKETRPAPPPQHSRTAGSTPQPPVSAPSAPVAPPAPMMVAPMTATPSIPPNTVTAAGTQAQGVAPQPQMVFTDMTFSVAPAATQPSNGGAPTHALAPVQQESTPNGINDMVDLTQFGGPADMTGNMDLSGFNNGTDSGMMDLTGMDNHNTNNEFGNMDSHNGTADMTNLDAEIDNLLNGGAASTSAEGMDMDYDLGNIEFDNNNNNFADSFYENAGGGDEDFGQDPYFGIG
ncbi:hypothetical protein GE09DRAFT_94401 [Coniochaeta sp. 2T2.1]|nr:hypothetical protein GE09DRAFT_94401 [Coniochaeta sp. 2T2.1]